MPQDSTQPVIAPNDSQLPSPVSTNDANPVEPVVAQPNATPATADAEADNSAKKILVVEDEPDARTMFVDMISMEGYDVSSAVDGIDALAKAEAEKYDLILLDIVMPNKDGLEVLEDLMENKEKYGSPIVIMLTNISGDAAVEKAMELGAKGFKLKIGTEPDALVKDISDYLAGKTPSKPAGEVEPGVGLITNSRPVPPVDTGENSISPDIDLRRVEPTDPTAAPDQPVAA